MSGPRADEGGTTAGPRIAFVLAQLGRGGTEEQARLLISGCDRRGLDVSVFVLARRPDASELEPEGVSVIYLDRVRRRRSVFGVVRAARALRRALRDGDYDVVHAILARAHVLAPLLAPRHTRVAAWRRNLGDHVVRHRVFLLAERVAARRTDAIIANSDPVADYWARALRIPRAGIAVIPNALEEWRFEHVPALDLGPEPLLVTVGGLRAVKGQSVLLVAAALLRPGHRVRVAVIGDGPLGEALTAQAKSAGIPLELPGHVPDPRPWLGAAAVYVHPSLSEGSSNAVIEAMAYGCPIVATRTGDSAANLEGCGLITEPGDPAALAARITELLDDPALAARLGCAAQAAARERFTMERMVSDHVHLYERLVGSGSN